MSETSTMDTVRSRLDSLKIVRDEIRLQLHLAGLDAKNVWERLETRLDTLELESKRAGSEAVDSVISSVEALSKSLHEFKSNLDKKVS